MHDSVVYVLKETMFVIVGLGNPGDEYHDTRHNVGRIVLADVIETYAFPEPVGSRTYASLISEGHVDREKVLIMFPETYMNKSGSAVKKAVPSAKKAQKLIVVYDDIDLPLGTIKISYGRGSGGHNGIRSIIRALGTKDFVRVRVGIAPTTPKGTIRKPKGQQKVLDFLMGDFKKREQDVLKKVSRTITKVLETIITKDVNAAMNAYN